MNNESNLNEEFEQTNLIEVIHTRVSADEKIKALRMSQSLQIPLSTIVRALLAQALAEFSRGTQGAFALEQDGMQSVLNALTPARKGPKL